MHLGHANDAPDDQGTVASGDSGGRVSERFAPVNMAEADGRADDPRCAAAEIDAFSIVASGGLIPHARQGGSGVEAVAVAGSKLDGTGFEKEQIGHTQVAFTGLGAGDAPRGSDGAAPCNDAEAGWTVNGFRPWPICDCPAPRFWGLG